MKRRDFIKRHATTVVSATTVPFLIGKTHVNKAKRRKLRIAHITDLHIRPEENVPLRAEKCLNEILTHKVDFFLNGGDTIHDASYNGVTRERMLEQWKVWDDFRVRIKDYEVWSCLGNHDMWWDVEDKSDDMYGKSYVLKRLNIPHHYYALERQGWHFICLDSNYEHVSLGNQQMQWLEGYLDNLKPNTPVLIMSHYPILGITGHFVGGQHSDFKELKTLFYKHRDKVKICISGHQHMLDYVEYNGTSYCCNGALSGYWWGEGDEHSAGRGYYLETPPGYAIIDLYEDGTFTNIYHPHNFV